MVDDRDAGVTFGQVANCKHSLAPWEVYYIVNGRSRYRAILTEGHAGELITSIGL
jgi:hypothetical protein